MTVAVVTCAYGTHIRFFPRWLETVRLLGPKPDRVIVATDNGHFIDARDVDTVETRCRWTHPQAWHLDQAVRVAGTDWVWVVDVDDMPHPDGLAGLDYIEADVWQLGYRDSDGYQHRPPELTNAEYLALDCNPYAAGSAFRTDAYRHAGGYPDIAFQDWGLWRRLALSGAVFEPSDRAHYTYQRHPHTRSATELTPDTRARNVAEMLESEALLAA